LHSPVSSLQVLACVIGFIRSGRQDLFSTLFEIEGWNQFCALHLSNWNASREFRPIRNVSILDFLVCVLIGRKDNRKTSFSGYGQQSCAANPASNKTFFRPFCWQRAVVLSRNETESTRSREHSASGMLLEFNKH